MFGPLLLGAALGGAASALSLREHYRAQLGAFTWDELARLPHLAVTPIAQSVDAGLVRLEGTVTSLAPALGYYDRVPCAHLALHHYEIVGGRFSARRALVREERPTGIFLVEDGSGVLRVDPSVIRVDAEVQGRALENAVEEHRLRVGERVVMLGVVRRVPATLGSAMRQAPSTGGASWELASGVVSWRSEPELRPTRAPSASGVLLAAASAALGALGASMPDL